MKKPRREFVSTVDDIARDLDTLNRRYTTLVNILQDRVRELATQYPEDTSLQVTYFPSRFFLLCVIDGLISTSLHMYFFFFFYYTSFPLLPVCKSHDSLKKTLTFEETKFYLLTLQFPPITQFQRDKFNAYNFFFYVIIYIYIYLNGKDREIRNKNN